LFEGKIENRPATIIANTQSKDYLEGRAKSFTLVNPDHNFLRQPR
jgi:hypothetical protein